MNTFREDFLDYGVPMYGVLGYKYTVEGTPKNTAEVIDVLLSTRKELDAKRWLSYVESMYYAVYCKLLGLEERDSVSYNDFADWFYANPNAFNWELQSFLIKEELFR